MADERSHRGQARLEQSLGSLIERFGLDVLRQPSRLGNLLRDEYGNENDRGAIAELVTLLECGALSALDDGERWSSVINRVALDTGLPEHRVATTLTMLNALRPGAEQVVDPIVQERTTIGAADVTVFEDAPATTPPKAGTRKWILALAAAGLLGITGVWLVGRGDGEDWKARALAAEQANSTFDRDTGDSPIDDRSDDRTTAAPKSDDVTDDVNAGQVKTLQEEVDALSKRNDELAEDLATARSRIDNKDAKIRDLTNQLAPFDTSDFAPPPGRLDGTGTLAACDGFDECGETFYQDSYILLEGQQRYFESREVAKVPIATVDGVRWAGSADVVGAYGRHICNGANIPTVMSVDLVPARIEADPATQSVRVAAYTVSVTYTSTGSACTDALRTYVGTFSY